MAGLAIMVAAAWSGRATAEYELRVKAGPGTIDGLLNGANPDAELSETAPGRSVSASESDQLDSICWRDAGLQVLCEAGTTPSGAAVETLSAGRATGEAFAEVSPTSDPLHPGFSIVTLRARSESALTPTHMNIAGAAAEARASYVTRLHFERSRDCAAGAVSVDVIVRGKSTLAQSGQSQFASCHATSTCGFWDPSAVAKIGIYGPWLFPDHTRTGYIASAFFVSTHPDEERVVGYSTEPGTHTFTAVKDSKIDDVFGGGSEGLRLEVQLRADTSVRGQGDEAIQLALDEEATLVGFVFWASNDRSRLLDLPDDAVTITDDAGYRFRVLPIDEVRDLYPETTESPCGSSEPTPDPEPSDADVGADGEAPDKGCGSGHSIPSRSLELALAVLALAALRSVRPRARTPQRKETRSV